MLLDMLLALGSCLSAALCGLFHARVAPCGSIVSRLVLAIGEPRYERVLAECLLTRNAQPLTFLALVLRAVLANAFSRANM